MQTEPLNNIKQDNIVTRACKCETDIARVETNVDIKCNYVIVNISIY